MSQLHSSVSRTEQIQLTTNSHGIGPQLSAVTILKRFVILGLLSTCMSDIYIHPTVILASKVNEDAAKSKGKGGGVITVTLTEKY